MGGWAAAAAAVVGAISSSESASDATDAQLSGQNLARLETRQAAMDAREAAIPLFQSAQQNALGGFQNAMDIFGQTAPQQAQAFQQGNNQAQQTLLAGMPQFQNAILGNPVNNRALQARSVDFDPSVFNQQLPQFQSITDALNLFKPPINTNEIDPNSFGPNNQSPLPQSVQDALTAAGFPAQQTQVGIAHPNFQSQQTTQTNQTGTNPLDAFGSSN